MNELQKNLDQAFKLLAAISIRGEDAELMAAAKDHLRAAYKLAEGEDKAEG